jgi:putative membrane protein
MRLIAKWFISAGSLLLTAHFIPAISIDSVYIALVIAVLLGVVNAIIRPILIVLTLPVTVLTLGLFIFFINGFLFWFLSTFIEQFHVDGIWWGVVGAFVVSVFSWIGNQLIGSNSSQIQHRS